MKNDPVETPGDTPELRAEYELDYHSAKPNRFASRLVSGGRLVILPPELAAVFPSSESVSEALKKWLSGHSADNQAQLGH
jgi:hypothetical protein